MHEQLSTFLETNNLLTESQYGFRKQRSTEAAVTLCSDRIREAAGEGKLTGAVFLDLTRAFDNINHASMLNKLGIHGVRDVELEWFKSYMFQRSQVIDIDSNLSEEMPLFTGVPQGTILGPLLFIVFIDDFEKHLQHSEVIQYADDTVIMFADKDVQAISKSLNEDLENISKYCYENELLMNLKKGKTEAMLFGTAQKLSRIKNELKLQYRNTPIQNVNEYRYLGNIMDCKLLMNTDFDNKCKKISQRLKLLSRIRQCVTQYTAEKIYNIMIMPILTYCSQLHVFLNTTQSKKLAAISNRASRIINNTDLRCRDLQKSVEIHNNIFIKRCLENKLCENFKNYFRINNLKVNTRNRGILLTLPKVKLEFERRAFYFYGAKLFNDLPKEIRNESDFTDFKISLRKHLNHN